MGWWHWGRRAQALQWRDVRQDVARLWPFLCLHSGVWECSMESVGCVVLTLLCHRQKHRLNPPQLPAQDRACAPQGLEGAVCVFKGGFCTNILLLLLTERHSTRSSLGHKPGLALPGRAEISSLATAPHHAQGEGGSASCSAGVGEPLCGRTSLPTAFHNSLLSGVRYWNL